MSEAANGQAPAERGRNRWYDPVGILVSTLILVTGVTGLASYLLNKANLNLQDEIKGLRTELEAEKEKKLRFLGTIRSQADKFSQQGEQFQTLLKECGCDAKPPMLRSSDATTLPARPPLTREELAQYKIRHVDWLDSNGAKGTRADLRDADLRGKNLSKANLRNAMMVGADLRGAQLQEADLSGAILIRARFNEANLQWANLNGAVLVESDFTDSDCALADLRNANLLGAVLTRANLRQAKLANADFSYTQLDGAVFIPESIPDVGKIATAGGLFGLRFTNRPGGLSEKHPLGGVQLRNAFREGGFHRQEREVTFAIRHIPDKPGVWDRITAVLFEWTCAWGMKPLRPLKYLVWLFLLCTIIYWLSMLPLFRFRRTTGIYKDFETEEKSEPVPIFCGDSRSFFLGLYFSATSAFYIGWQELKLANWLVRLNPQQYKLRATGRMRIVSALQAIVSTYLLALWILTTIGNPF